jgi:hypothetical protein
MRRAALLLVLALVANGCAVTGIAFRQDDRLTFESPDDREEVTLPVTVTWSIDDFDVPTEGGYAVFVDRSPQPPGKTLEWLARNDDSCRADDGCPDEEWFSQRDVFPTTETSFTIERLPARSDDRREFHEVTVVLIDRDGRRIGETGWTLEFQVERDE